MAMRAQGFQRERLQLREQLIQHPFGLLLLVLFLQEQEKNREYDSKINGHLILPSKEKIKARNFFLLAILALIDYNTE